jgi:hypothetical protein
MTAASLVSLSPQLLGMDARDEEPEAQRGEVAPPRSHSQGMLALEVEAGSKWLITGFQ